MTNVYQENSWKTNYTTQQKKYTWNSKANQFLMDG